MPQVPDVRLLNGNAAPIQENGQYVLYWMIAQRRIRWNFGLQRAIEWASELGRPLVIFEPLRVGYRWASDRLHLFAIQGMADNARRLATKPVLYYPYVEPEPDADKGLLRALAEQACIVVTDDFPSFFLPRMVKAAARKMPVRVEQVDSNGLLPLRATDRVFTTAHSFRAFLQKELLQHLQDMPKADPFKGIRLPKLEALPGGIEKRWPRASEALLSGDLKALAKIPIDHSVSRSPIHGGSVAGEKLLKSFIDERLPKYLDRNEPDVPAASGLSPYLHWGHVSAHEVFQAVVDHEEWSIDKVTKSKGGKREGFWMMSAQAESFLDELITWRELGYNMSSKVDDYDQYKSLPLWALKTLRLHQKDARPHIYSSEELENGQTYDRLWNAAQLQLVREGRMHNYMRMLWGKRVLEWTRTPEEAFEILEHLNNKYAVDGRNPNSYSGILWVFGRYDRAWGPERPIYGKVRYMSSENTARKLKLKGYLEEFAPTTAEPPAATAPASRRASPRKSAARGR